jgi:hypothetical protein
MRAIKLMKAQLSEIFQTMETRRGCIICTNRKEILPLPGAEEPIRPISLTGWRME